MDSYDQKQADLKQKFQQEDYDLKKKLLYSFNDVSNLKVKYLGFIIAAFIAGFIFADLLIR